MPTRSSSAAEQSDRPATIIDLTRETGVSKSTVSRVINGHRNVSSDVRARVLEAISKRDYQLNAAARALRTERRDLVGLVVPGIRHVFYNVFAEVLERDLRSHGMSLLIACSGGIAEGELIAIRSLRSHGADAFVVSLVDEEDPRVVAALGSICRPIVLLDREVHSLGADAVLTDHRSGLEESIEHLTSLGHTSIGLICHAPVVRPGRQVKRVFERALERRGLTPVGEVVIRFDQVDSQTGADAAHQLVDLGATAILSLCPSPMSAGVLSWLRERGLQVPGDVSVIVYDETDFSSVMRPSLSAVVRPIASYAHHASGLLMARLAQPAGAPATEIVKTRLVVRESTGPCAFSSWMATSAGPGLEAMTI